MLAVLLFDKKQMIDKNKISICMMVDKNMILNKNLKTVKAFSYIGLFIIWGVLETGIVPFMEQWLSVPDTEFIKEVVFKIIIWFIPAFLLCRHYDDFLSIQSKSSFSVEVKWLRVLPILFLFTAFHIISACVQHGKISIDSSFRITDILIAVSVGISEEMVFRGWLLNVCLHDKKWVSIIENAVLFLLIHFPVWIRHDLLSVYIMSGAFLQIIILSIIFSCAFIKSRNILVPVVLHAYWDLLCFIL
ncbi:MAG: type II CAAX endopeptidase family protein [Eubacteriales bacterium]|nr:type II CAAX endopeptidase family protein [Eubacteriales bacterium]